MRKWLVIATIEALFWLGAWFIVAWVLKDDTYGWPGMLWGLVLTTMFVLLIVRLARLWRP